MIRILLILLGALLCLTRWAGPARADDVGRVLRVLCPGRSGGALPALIRVEARRHLLRAEILAAVVGHESGCRADADSGAGDLGLGQIRLGTLAAAGRTRVELLTPSGNVYLTARHLAWCLTLCGGRLRGALSVYSGRRWCRDSTYAKRVVEILQ